MAEKRFQLDATTTLKVDESTGKYTLEGSLLAEPRPTASGNSVILASTPSSGIAGVLEWKGVKYALRLQSFLFGKTAVPTAEMLERKKQAKAERLKAQLAALGVK